MRGRHEAASAANWQRNSRHVASSGLVFSGARGIFIVVCEKRRGMLGEGKCVVVARRRGYDLARRLLARERGARQFLGKKNNRIGRANSPAAGGSLRRSKEEISAARRKSAAHRR